MATRPKSKCKHNGCFELTNNNYCDKHTIKDVVERKNNYKLYNEFKRPEHHKEYNTKEWKQMRSEIMSTNPMCECGNKATICHHIKDTKNYPELILDKTNIKPVCQKCHNKFHYKKKDAQKECKNI